MVVARSVNRPASTYKVRRRAMAPARQERFVRWLDRYGLDESGPPVDWVHVFSDLVPGGSSSAPARAVDVVLDVGFGHGESTLAAARSDRSTGIVGFEVHTPGVATVLEAIETEQLDNVRVVFGDVLYFLDRVPPASLAGVRVFFPDPWPKARQHHRRLIARDTVAAFTDRLRPGGWLHLATDIADYAASMRAACDAEPRLSGGVVERPAERPLTRFEQRGLDAGRTPVDLHYTRSPH